MSRNHGNSPRECLLALFGIAHGYDLLKGFRVLNHAHFDISSSSYMDLPGLIADIRDHQNGFRIRHCDGEVAIKIGNDIHIQTFNGNRSTDKTVFCLPVDNFSMHNNLVTRSLGSRRFL